MRTKLFSLLLFLIIGIQSLTAQTYYKDYQDGLVVFQLKLNQKRILSKDKVVDFKKYTLFTKYLKDYKILEVRQLHPNIDDNKLNRTYQIQLEDYSKVDVLARKLNQNPIIEYAELKPLFYSTMTPNDTYYGSQWSLPKINAEQAWDMSTGSPSVVVAVTDNAIYVNHPDLQANMLTGYNAADGGTDPSPCGSNTGDHGTHVSGIIGATSNNNQGVASIGSGVSILPVKIGDCSGGALPYGYDGVVWAANNGADIINMSWGSSGGGQYGQNVMNNAWNQGCILVAAAGNDGVSSVFYPAGYNNVIAVASTDQYDNLSSFSNYGSWIDISAPGSHIASTVNPNGNYGASYAYMDGTSMASPLVAGLLGLMESYAPSASRTDIINCLYSSAVNIGSNAGNGRIDALAALQCLSSYNVQYDASITEIIAPNGSLCASTISPQIELKNMGSETLTSATITYDWGAPSYTYNWTGSLSTGQSTTITLPNQTLSDGSYTFSATVSSPNGNPDENNANDNATSSFIINSGGETVTLDLQTDCFGSDITWELRKDSDNSLVADGGPYSDVTGGTNDIRSFCLTDGCYTFTINDSYGDGLKGSQYQGCSTDGDFNMKDGNNTILFEMTAPDGNFGYSENHQFCINNSINDDAGITKINAPDGISCSATVSPVVVLKNFGSNTLTAVTIQYQTSGGWQNYNWTGSLATNQTTTVSLPSIPIANGQQTITVKTNQPNGNADGNTANDQTVKTISIQSTAASLPFIEDFEGTNSNWTIVNPDNAITWSYAMVGGISPGNTAAKIDFFNYQQSERRDGLISPKIDLTGVVSAQMTFDHAYRRYNQSAADSLVIYASTDCGVTWNRIIGWAEDGTGSFATQTTNTNEFTPSVPEDWCFTPISQQTPGASCFTVNLDAFTGNNVFVKFQSYNAGNTGNNLFIDNINIDGQPAGNPPSPNMSQDVNQICEGETITYTDLSTNNPTSWNWIFPGGSPSSSTNQNPTVTYNTSGTYDVTLEVSNSNGTDTHTFTNAVVVDAPPQVNVTASQPSICEGESTMVSVSGNADSYMWNHGLGSGSSYTVTPLVGTTYEVTGTTGSCETTASVSVVVNPTPNVTLNANQIEICEGENVVLTAGGASTYSWDNGLTGNGNVQTVSPTSTTTYEVTGTNGNCSGTATVEVVVNPIPTVTLNASQIEICEGEDVVLTAGGASTYSWDNGLTGNGNVQTVSPTSTTTYEVTGTNGNCSGTATVVVVVNNIPSLIINASQTNICQGTNVTLTASGATNYTWDNNLGNGSNQNVTPSATTTYTVTGSNGLCDTQEAITIVVNNAPDVQLSATENTICEGESTTIVANGADNYSWSPGSDLNITTGASVIASPTSTTTYSVMGSNNCGITTETIVITVNPLPGAPVILQTGNTLSVNLQSGESAVWVVDGNTYGSGSSITLPQIGTYNVEVIVSSADGCEASTNEVIVIENSGLDQENISSQLNIYPNPTEKTVMVTLVGNDKIESIQVFDALGRSVLNYNALKENKQSINLESFDTGVYILELKTQNKTLTRRVIKK